MNKPELSHSLQENHKHFLQYIDSLTESEFLQSTNGKWTAGQQLEHILKSIKTIAKIFGQKTVIETQFGRIQRPTLSYETLIAQYQDLLDKGGKAPERYLPSTVGFDQKTDLITAVESKLAATIQYLDNYTESEMDTLTLPHPILGILSLREMLYLITYHVTHHHKQVQKHLAAAPK